MAEESRQIETGGQRLDAFLAGAAEGLTRSAVQKLIERGLVQVNGAQAKKNLRLEEGDRVSWEAPEPEPLDAVPQNIPLDVALEDGDVIVINKPVGMVVHPAPGHLDGTLVNALLYHCGSSLSGINGAVRPGIVHRIDQNTSGLIIVAKNDRAHLALAAQLQDHTLFREYEAVAHGGFRADSGTVDAPIGRSPRDRKKMAVRRDGGREAVTHWAVLERLGQYTRLSCRLETGRTHQIRVHMAHLGHPLLGDETYGGKPFPGLAGQCLHAKRLSFIHPATGQGVTVETPLPPWFEAALEKLRRQR